MIQSLGCEEWEDEKSFGVEMTSIVSVELVTQLDRGKLLGDAALSNSTTDLCIIVPRRSVG